MAVKLADVPQEVERDTALTVVEQGTGKASGLAVAERTDGALILARKSERTVKDPETRKATTDEHGQPVRETIWKPTATLADFARALSGGLIA